MNERSHDVSVLNSLIETVLDSCEGYREAADQAKNPMITDLFRRWAADRERAVSGLKNAARELGGNPADNGTVLASAHRMFLDLRAKVSKGDKAVVQEVERGEDHIKHKFDDALKDDKLSTLARTAVESAYGSVKRGHDELRDLQRAYE
jgi:uncharacterized protein (TIGR02284 family)